MLQMQRYSRKPGAPKRPKVPCWRCVRSCRDGTDLLEKWAKISRIGTVQNGAGLSCIQVCIPKVSHVCHFKWTCALAPKAQRAFFGTPHFWLGGTNPRYCANYLDEDFVRRSKKLAIISNPRFVSKQVLFRYSVAACLRWTDMMIDWSKQKKQPARGSAHTFEMIVGKKSLGNTQLFFLVTIVYLYSNK